MNSGIKLNIDYQGANRMESFLRSVEEPLVIVPFNYQNWKLKEYIGEAIKLVSSSNQPITITILFCTSYNDACEVAEANNFPYLPTAKWSLNGNLLYMVESEDPEKVSNVLSLFAGRE